MLGHHALSEFALSEFEIVTLILTDLKFPFTVVLDAFAYTVSVDDIEYTVTVE